MRAPGPGAPGTGARAGTSAQSPTDERGTASSSSQGGSPWTLRAVRVLGARNFLPPSPISVREMSLFLSSLMLWVYVIAALGSSIAI